MIRRAEGRRRTIFDSDDEYVDDKNLIFGQINGAPRCGISLHTTPTTNRSKKRDGIENQYLLQGKYKAFQNKTTYVCSDCADTDGVKNKIWVFHSETSRSCFSQHVHITHDF